MKGYVQLRRGLLGHLKIMSGAELKVYNALLILADFKTGKTSISIGDLAEIVGYSRRHIRDAVKQLEALSYIKVNRSRDRWHDTVITITKHRKPGSDVASYVTSYVTSDVQDSGQPKGAPKNLKNLKNLKEKNISTLSGKPDDIGSVLTYLNEKTGRKYRLTDTNRSLIVARLRDYSVEEMRGVIDAKCQEWLGTDQARYLRPQTLFNATKFDNYMNETSTASEPKRSLSEIIEEATKNDQ